MWSINQGQYPIAEDCVRFPPKKVPSFNSYHWIQQPIRNHQTHAPSTPSHLLQEPKSVMSGGGSPPAPTTPWLLAPTSTWSAPRRWFWVNKIWPWIDLEVFKTEAIWQLQIWKCSMWRSCFISRFYTDTCSIKIWATQFNKKTAQKTLNPCPRKSKYYTREVCWRFS